MNDHYLGDLASTRSFHALCRAGVRAILGLAAFWRNNDALHLFLVLFTGKQAIYPSCFESSMRVQGIWSVMKVVKLLLPVFMCSLISAFLPLNKSEILFHNGRLY